MRLPDEESEELGFVSKYQKGATVPTGETEFQFIAGNLNFHSDAYQWLVVAGSLCKAQYKGTGSVNGVGGYTFMVTVIDGANCSPAGADQFRIKITGPGGLVYDNAPGSDDIDASATQAVGGGSIVIHK